MARPDDPWRCPICSAKHGRDVYHPVPSLVADCVARGR